MTRAVQVQPNQKRGILMKTGRTVEKGGAAASINDLKVGDRGVIHATKMSDKLMATEVRFGVVVKSTRQP